MKARGNVDVRSTKISNYTFLFGCNPAEGVAADTKFVEAFIDHIYNLFDPDDGSVMIPECFGMIDVMRHSVNFESTSGHLGRSLLLRRQDNRIGPKQLIVIVEETSKDKPNEPKAKTTLMTDFF